MCSVEDLSFLKYSHIEALAATGTFYAVAAALYGKLDYRAAVTAVTISRASYVADAVKEQLRFNCHVRAHLHIYRVFLASGRKIARHHTPKAVEEQNPRQYSHAATSYDRAENAEHSVRDKEEVTEIIRSVPAVKKSV